MDDGYSPVGILLLIGFILLEAAFYGFGSAIQNMDEDELEEEAGKGDAAAARMLRVIENPANLINTIQIMTHLVGMIMGAIFIPVLIVRMGRLTQTWFPSADGIRWYENPGWWVQAGLVLVISLVILILVVCFGVLIPKRMAAVNPKGWGYRVLPVVTFTAGLFLPLSKLVRGVSVAVLALFKVKIQDNSENVTEEDIMSMVNEGHEQGILKAGETKMITNIFQLGETEAQDIMTHRTNMEILDDDMTLQEAVSFILNEGNKTRYPVSGEDIDDIIGILHMRDAMSAYEKEENRPVPIGKIPGLLMEASFIPATRSIDTLFKEMQSRKIHMEIVVDEYGQRAGLLTMEDILEEIVGSIQDEYDNEEECITEQPDHSYVMKGMTDLEEVQEILGLTLSQEDSDTYGTLSGFLIARLDRIPKEDERPAVEYGGYHFQVLKVGNKTIESVQVSRIEEPERKEESHTGGAAKMAVQEG